MLSTPRLLVLIAVAALVAVPAAHAQRWAVPAKTQNTDVICSTCPEGKAGRPTKGYSSPVATFTGRYLDSTMTRDLTSPFRTARAATGLYIVPSLNRLYMRVGSAVFAYSLDTFFTRLESGEPLRRPGEIELLKPDPHAREVFLPFDNFFYAERSDWTTFVQEGVERLGKQGNRGFDVDEEGYIYLAYTIFGWGIVRDPLQRNEDLMPTVTQQYGLDFSPSVIIHARGATRYAFVSDGVGLTDVYDVTDRRNPQRLRRINVGIDRFAKSENGTRIAIIDQTGQVSIYTPDELASGRKTLTIGTSRRYEALTTDGTNFYAVARAASAGIDITTLRPSAGSYIAKTHRTGPLFATISEVQYGAGLLAISGATSSWDIALYRVEPNGFTQIPTNDYFRQYYSAAPPGYVTPEYINIFDALPYAAAGKTYLIMAAWGLGDVYQLAPDAAPPVCTLSCSANAPLIAEQNEPITFRNEVAARSACFPITFTWQPSDASSPVIVGDTFTHAYTQPGIYRWTVTSTGNGGTCTFNQSIAIVRKARTRGSILSERVIGENAVRVSSTFDSALQVAGPRPVRINFPEYTALSSLYAQYSIFAFVEPATLGGAAPAAYQLRVTDPTGVVTSSTIQSTDTAYIEADVLTGLPVTIVLSDNVKPGPYRIEVIPEGGAAALMSIVAVSQLGPQRSVRILVERQPLAATTLTDYPSCLYLLNISTGPVSGGGETRAAAVTAGGTCAWTATSTVPWITLGASGGTGSGSIQYTVAPNPSRDARSGTIFVAGQRIDVVQAGATVAGRRRAVRR